VPRASRALDTVSSAADPERKPRRARAPKEPASAAHTFLLGHRGAPQEAPENTLASLRRALEHGLDGFEYDVQRCASGEAFLLHDDELERTTDGNGPIAARSLPELTGLDAGSWFDARFRGEPLPQLEQALALARELGAGSAAEPPLHMIELKDAGLVPVVARALASWPGLPVRIASFHRSVCVEARERGLPCMLLARHAQEDDRLFVRDEGIDAHGVGPGGWDNAAGELEWPCERWSWSVDEPRDLERALRRPLFGLNTNEPERALALRRLVELAPHWTGGPPLEVPRLAVEPARFALGRGEWCGAWTPHVRVHNPFAWRVRVDFALRVRRGTFELGALPAARTLEPGAACELEFELTGGSFSPGGDPRFAVRYAWKRGGQAHELVLDATLHRTRRVHARAEALRLPMLRERPDEVPASMTLRRIGGELVASVEDAGGLSEVRALALFGGELVRGGRGLRLKLPRELPPRGQALELALGFEGVLVQGDARTRRTRRWCGGLPPGIESGAPGELVLRESEA